MPCWRFCCEFIVEFCSIFGEILTRDYRYIGLQVEHIVIYSFASGSQTSTFRVTKLTEEFQVTLSNMPSDFDSFWQLWCKKSFIDGKLAFDDGCVKILQACGNVSVACCLRRCYAVSFPFPQNWSLDGMWGGVCSKGCGRNGQKSGMDGAEGFNFWCAATNNETGGAGISAFIFSQYCWNENMRFSII